MAFYLLKFSACLILFIVFYKLVLEKENMHVFKRFFLLGALIASICIPFVTFTYYVEPTTTAINSFSQDLLVTNDTPAIESINYLLNTAWTIYAIGVLLFGLKYIRNLYQLNNTIKFNPKSRNNKFTHVLLQDLIVPHTFFNYLFFNKSKFEAHEIPEEVFWHEQTHAVQKHSIDVLFIEALQVILWFNPLIYVIKHIIKLNHEFLADQGVLQKGINTNTYQEIILAFSSNATQPQLANAINYSLIKKRFTVMKTQTTKQSVWLRSFILLPLLALMLFSFSNEKIIEEEIIPKDNIIITEDISVLIKENGLLIVNNNETSKDLLLSELENYNRSIPYKDRNHIKISIEAEPNTPMGSISDIKQIINSYGIAKILINKSPLLNQEGATKSQLKEYNKLAKKYNDMPEDDMIIKKSDLERLKYLYSIMSSEQRKSVESFPNIPAPPAPRAPAPMRTVKPNLPPPPPVPADASNADKKKYKEAIKNYKQAVEIATQNEKKLIKVRKINDAEKVKLRKVKEQYVVERAAMSEAKKLRVIELKENQVAERVLQAKERKLILEKTKVARMSQKEALSEERKIKLVKEKLQRLEEIEVVKEQRKMKLVKEKLQRLEQKEVANEQRKRVLVQEKLRHVQERQVVTEQKKEMAIAARLQKKEERIVLREIKAPKPPKSPLNHVIEMAKNNAVFYFEGKEISSDDAIKKLKNNEKMNVRTIGRDSKRPKVHLSTKPMVVEIKEKT